MYYVVAFPEEDDQVAVVPEHWVTAQGTMCYWPPAGRSADAAARQLAPVTATWSISACRLLGSYGEFVHI